MTNNKDPEDDVIDEALCENAVHAIWNDITSRPGWYQDLFLGRWDDTHGLLSSAGTPLADEDK